MKILAIDIGSRTQDIILYDTSKEIENSIKLVLPSPHMLISQKISEIENDIYFDGEIIGGGKIKQSILKHIEKGYSVVMEPHCARTIRDDINQVKSYGIDIVDKKIDYSGYTKITLSEVNISKLSNFLFSYDLNFDFDKIAIAVQDHGFDENKSDRDFRFCKIREKLISPINPKNFLLSTIPIYYTRMKSIENSIKKENIDSELYIMDTKFASICGMVYDNFSKKFNNYIVVDIGNGHTMAASIKNGKIQGLFEHHTSNLTGEKLEKYIIKLSNNTLSNNEIYSDHGHGAHVLNPISNIEKVIVTGPKRDLIKNTNLDYHFITPGGDVMMTGVYGLIKAVEKC